MSKYQIGVLFSSIGDEFETNFILCSSWGRRRQICLQARGWPVSWHAHKRLPWFFDIVCAPIVPVWPSNELLRRPLTWWLLAVPVSFKPQRKLRHHVMNGGWLHPVQPQQIKTSSLSFSSETLLLSEIPNFPRSPNRSRNTDIKQYRRCLSTLQFPSTKKSCNSRNIRIPNCFLALGGGGYSHHALFRGGRPCGSLHQIPNVASLGTTRKGSPRTCQHKKRGMAYN